MRVLVVDDNSDIREVVRRSLALEGFDVVEAGDAETAMRLTQEQRVEVALLDLRLPDASGLELMAQLRERFPGLHVIMLTGAGSEADRVRGLVSGADDYVVKPFSLPELVARVAAAGRRLAPAPATVIDGGGLHVDVVGRESSVEGRPLERLAGSAPESTKDATVVIAGGAIAHANQAAIALLGATRMDDVTGHDLFDFVAPQSLSASVALRQSASEGRWLRPEVISIVRLDGREVLVEIASLPVLWDGRPASQVTIWELAGETLKLQELATGIRTDVADAIVIADAQMRIQSFNPAAEELYGWREQEVVGLKLGEVLPWDRDDHRTQRAQAAMRLHGRWHGEVVQRRRDGTCVRVRTSSTILRDSSGSSVGLITVNRPVTASDARATVDLTSGDGGLDNDIRRGMAGNEFTVHYQPVVRLDDVSWSGVEALVRWEHPDRGLLAPAAFIDAAERSGSILDLGQIVLDEAAGQWATWDRAGLDLHMAVNLSGRQLSDPSFVDHLGAAMANLAIPPGALWLEVTETSLVEDLDQATKVLRRLTELGAHVSIDDFGTGWASLTYLREFPVHALKIDRVFVNGMGRGSTDTAIVSSILSLGAELGLSVIAEGIETEEQLDRLRRLGCELGQGYLFGRPLPPDELVPSVGG